MKNGDLWLIYLWNVVIYSWLTHEKWWFMVGTIRRSAMSLRWRSLNFQRYGWTNYPLAIWNSYWKRPLIVSFPYTVKVAIFHTYVSFPEGTFEIFLVNSRSFLAKMPQSEAPFQGIAKLVDRTNTTPISPWFTIRTQHLITYNYTIPGVCKPTFT